ncbi:fluoride efflux transporter CrcB [Bacillus sp. HNG]|uniref:fluoride efflux transporter CrcB n=1 Tax=Bacillus sp. HNG TaxID=2293325 RepID=UPI000E2F1D51|nr:fluoride efflux transporter CrcB [Bacillus sp. HNG]RFB18466.1 fluoride efflux transporter CrcB [Bacillus sp. HNG]
MIILVGIGGAVGAASRYLAGIWIGKKTGNAFPYPTLYINIMGSFLLGILTGMNQIQILPKWCWLLLGVGFCGAFTTFSTFGYEAIQLFLSKQLKKAYLYIVASTIICTISAFIGILLLT